MLPYFDAMIAAWHAGQIGRHVHFGWWPGPVGADAHLTPTGFLAAQQRLTDRVLALAPPRPGMRILDAGCGLGGTLEALDRLAQPLLLVGLNIDARQLAICRTCQPRPRNRLDLLLGDACAMPLADKSFDLVISLEAAFHFARRGDFLAEAARVLRPGGALLLADILLRPPPARAPFSRDDAAEALRRDYGPWPAPWEEEATLIEIARAAGLHLLVRDDLTAGTMPTHRFIIPEAASEDVASAAAMLRWLHLGGHLSYVCWHFRRGEN
jgi:SAM-dependent methyltransferase